MTRNEQIETAVLQRQAARLVEREVLVCLSSVVSTLANAYGHGLPRRSPHAIALDDLASEAQELCEPLLDYESAAREAGWTHVAAIDGGGYGAFHPDADLCEAQDAHCATAEEAWQNACEASGVDPHEIEVYEHWAVSSWLAEKLIAKGERVDTDFAGLNVWARTTTGQAISIDSVIEAITKETGYASHPATDAA